MKRSMLALAGALGLAWTFGAGAALAGKADDTLNWATDREIAVIDPYYNNTRELVIIGHIAWDALVYRNIDTGDFEPLLATSWKWLDDVTLEFQLRKGVKFHDGSDFDADDVVYTVNHTANKDNGVLTYQLVGWMKSAEKVDSHTVKINLKAPFPAALAYMANAVFILPNGHYDSAPAKADGTKDFGTAAPVGTGPYRVTDIKAGEYVLMEKNDAYFAGGPKGTPQIGKMRFRTLKEMNTQIAELLTGGLDWIWDVPKDQAERLASQPAITVENAKTMRVSYMAFDVNGVSGDKHFTDKRVRQAVAHAIDRQAIATNLVGPASVVINSACHPDQFGCTQDVPRYDHNPDKAKALLAEAGYPDGFEFDIYAYRQREFTEAVIGDLARVGLKAKLNFMQYRALRDVVRQGKTPINHMTWGSNSIPDVSAITGHFFKHGPDDLSKDDEVKALIEQGDTDIDAEKRKAVYQKALSKISGEVYWLPMFTYAKYYVYSSNLDFKATSDEIPPLYRAKWK